VGAGLASGAAFVGAAGSGCRHQRVDLGITVAIDRPRQTQRSLVELDHRDVAFVECCHWGIRSRGIRRTPAICTIQSRMWRGRLTL